MKDKIFPLTVGAILCLSLSSCFKDEPLNAEADIEQAFLHSVDVETMFYSPVDTLVRVLSTESNIRFHVRPGTDRTSLAPIFRLTEGATISPANGSVQDFTQGAISYKVTSEDGNWSRDYLVSVSEKQRTIDEVEMLDFENYSLSDDGKYYVWKDLCTNDGYELDCWATGNPGFKISKGSAKADEYPTTPYELTDGSHAAKLTTRDTGAFGAMAGMRIAAGNLFLGKFDVTNALKDAMQATQFGVPVARKPITFSGKYQYMPGDKFQNKAGKTVEGRVDTGNIYAVLYKNTDAAGTAFVLHGDDVLSSSNIVATAIIDKVETCNEWKSFTIPFTYVQELDQNLLEAYGYNIAIVFTSSEKGADFEGAVGSTLLVDKVSITWE